MVKISSKENIFLPLRQKIANNKGSKAKLQELITQELSSPGRFVTETVSHSSSGTKSWFKPLFKLPMGLFLGAGLITALSLFSNCSKEDNVKKVDKKEIVNSKPKQYTKVNMREIFPSSKVKITPATQCVVNSKLFCIDKIAKEYKVSPTRIKNANPQLDKNCTVRPGDIIKIPESATVNLEKINSMNDIVEATGVSRTYIKDFMENIEVAGIKDICKAYDDKVNNENGKSKWTIGYGATKKLDGTPVKKGDEIEPKEALQLLARDLFNSKIEAIAYFGTDFLNAPKSIQEGIVDNFYNKGWDPGFTGENSPTKNIKKDLEKKDYVSTASDLLYQTKSQGLKKRVLYRIIQSTKDLSPKERKKVLDKRNDYYTSVRKLYSADPKYATELKLIDKAWKNAYSGKCDNFFD